MGQLRYKTLGFQFIVFLNYGLLSEAIEPTPSNG